MDFMDDDMKQIATGKFYGGIGNGVYAAREALAQQQCRQAPKEMDATMADESGKYALADTTPGACNWLNINDMKNMYAVVSVQATLPHAKEIIHFAWARLTGEQPADDVVQRMRDAVTGMRGMAAALAVAREGMVPASELSSILAREGWVPASEKDKLIKALVTEEFKHGVTHAKLEKAEQQLATMYSLKQVEKAVRAELKQRDHSWSNTLFMEHVVARLCLTAKQQPTEQERVEAVLNSWGIALHSRHKEAGDRQNENLAAEILAALGKGGK